MQDLTISQALTILHIEDTEISNLDHSTLRKHYLRQALATHPDKNPQNNTSAQHQFTLLTTAYELLLQSITTTSNIQRERQHTQSLINLLLRALQGEDVQQQLHQLGHYRPPAEFGINLNIPFDRRVHNNSNGNKTDDAYDMKKLFVDVFQEEGLDEEGNPLEGQ
jgi:hypothetical protein